MTDAPFHTELAEAPQQTTARWIEAADGMRLRISLCQPGGAKGLVLIFPGRTEVVEKYGRVMGRLTAEGYASAAIDWRGQGLAGRMLPDRLIGHVEAFQDYQKDVAAYVAALSDIPGPRYLLAHSMGGAIGLRALFNGLDVRAAAFSAPMWGIKMPAYQDTISRALIWALNQFGKGEIRAPGTVTNSYMLLNPFEGNNLTTDLDEWAYMRRQVQQVPDLCLAGPSIHWVREAIVECADLMRHAPSSMPLLAGLGSDETIVPKPQIENRVRSWPNAQIVRVKNARHELLMETPDKRAPFFDAMIALFRQHTG